MNLSRKHTPIYVVLGFNLLTLIAFLLAPFNWYNGAREPVILYLMLNFVCIYSGYKLGLKRGNRVHSVRGHFLSHPGKGFMSFVFVFYSTTFLVKYAYLTRFPIYDIPGMVSYLSVGFVDPNLAYYLSVYDTRPFTVSWFLFFLISLFNQAFFIFGFISWKRMGKVYRILFVLFLLIECFYWVGRATGFGVICLITTFVISLLVSSRFFFFSLKKVVYIVSLFLLSVIFYGTLKSYRAGDARFSLSQFDMDYAPVKENHFIFDVLPENIVPTYMFMTTYLVQGYHHLSLAMEAPFNSTYFMGNNPALINISNVIGIDDLWDRTYIHWLHTNKGVDEYKRWHSAYIWFANDVSFWGVPIVLLVLSYFFGFSYVLSLTHDDFLSKIVFISTGSILLYLFANNTYLYHLFYSFSLIIPLWIITRFQRRGASRFF